MKMDKGFGYNKCGIYCIKNIVNDKCYIGSSTHIYYRLRRHKSDLLRKVHANPILQNAYNKYGADSFVVSIVEECAEDVVLVREQHYIDIFLPVYNITKEVINNRLSPESRLKISNTMKAKAKAGIRVNCMNEAKRKQIDLYDCNCKFIKKFDSYNDAGRYLKELYPRLTPDSISTIVKGRRGRYRDHYLIKPNAQCDNSNPKHEFVNIKVTDITTNIEKIFKCLKDITEYFGCSKAAIHRVIRENKILLKKFKIEKL
jgi:hypothetical protein